MDEESNAAQKSEALRAASFQLLRIGVYSDIGLEQGIVLVLGDTVLFQRCYFGMLQVVLEGCCFGVQLL